MATRGQTHNKRARELALREKRERKQLKKEERAAGILPTDESDIEGDADSDADALSDEGQSDEEPTETAPEPIQ